MAFHRLERDIGIVLGTNLIDCIESMLCSENLGTGHGDQVLTLLCPPATRSGKLFQDQVKMLSP